MKREQAQDQPRTYALRELLLTKDAFMERLLGWRETRGGAEREYLALLLRRYHHDICKALFLMILCPKGISLWPPFRIHQRSLFPAPGNVPATPLSPQSQVSPVSSCIRGLCIRPRLAVAPMRSRVTRDATGFFLKECFSVPELVTTVD